MSALESANAARGRWPGILVALGVSSDFLKNEHGPCPICGGKDRFRFDDNMNGAWICSKCGAGDGFKLLQMIQNRTFRQVADEVDKIVGNIPVSTEKRQERSDDDKRKAMRFILDASRKVERGTAAWNYLCARCGDPGPSLADIWAHPGLRHRESGETFPAMLAVMRYPDGTGASVHRTWITLEGCKAPVTPARKIMNGFPVGTAAVRLGPIAPRIGIAEGIETAICAGKLFGLPVWAAISAYGLETFEPPKGVEEVVVFGDNDASFTGQAAAFAVAKRLRNLGLRVSVEIPPTVGTDWNDRFQEVA